MSLTLVGWKNSTTLLLINKLPLQDNQSASEMVSSYLSDIGGWIPTDPNHPTDGGDPANGETPTQASDTIAQLNYERIYNISSIENLKVKVGYTTNYASGQTDETIMTAIKDGIYKLISNQLEGTILELISVENDSATIQNGGMTTDSERRDIAFKEQSGELVDPLVIGLRLAISLYNLDDTHNVISSYNEDQSEIVISVRKYKDNTYTVLDKTAVYRYVLTLNSMTYTLSTGIVLPV